MRLRPAICGAFRSKGSSLGLGHTSGLANFTRPQPGWCSHPVEALVGLTPAASDSISSPALPRFPDPGSTNKTPLRAALQRHR